MTQSFVLICMKIKPKKQREKNEKSNWAQLIKRLANDISGYKETVFFLLKNSTKKTEIGLVLYKGKAFLSFYQRRKTEII